MKNVIRLTLQSFFLLILLPQWTGAQTADVFVPAASNLTGSEYPRISGNLRVSLRLKAPAAIKVQVAGALAPDQNPVDMLKDTDGNWNVTLPPAVPGFHYYWFMVDGVQVNDPGSDSYHGYGRPTSGIEIPTAGEDFYIAGNVPHGEVREHWYYSDITGKWRRAFVYTPPDYESTPAKKYPVLYLLHGAGENERGWSLQGHMSFILDNLIASGRTIPMIVVMDNGYAVDKNAASSNQITGPAPARVTSSAPRVLTPAQIVENSNRPSTLQQVYVKEILPAMESFYRIKPGRENRAMAGLSMGGGQTASIGLNHPELFSSLGFFSSGISADVLSDTRVVYGGVFADASSFNDKIKVFWFGAGTAEASLITRHADLKNKLAEKGINGIFYESPGTAHEWHTWRRCLKEFAPLLFK
jgi:enterochelin esterase-like enzyme